MNFLVDLGDGNTEGPQSGVFEVIFPESRVYTYEYRNGNNREGTGTIIQTTTRYGNLILKRGVNGDLSWYQWWNMIRSGAANESRTVVIQLQNEDRTAVVLTWRFLRARPVNYKLTPLNALGHEMFMEILELAFERLEIE
jgi:phage tail-like protein